MKDLSYFLDAEDNYCRPEMIYDPEHGLTYPEDPLSFLGMHRFHDFSDSLDEERFKKYGLTEPEALMLRCLVADLSCVFRKKTPETEASELIQEMRSTLESAIAKIPVFEGEVLYRFCNDYDDVDLVVGEEYIAPHSLTTTRDKWTPDDHTKVIYVITPLEENKTKAHSLYLVYKNYEWQVNFLTGARFRVDRIESIELDEVERKCIYMSEIE